MIAPLTKLQLLKLLEEFHDAWEKYIANPTPTSGTKVMSKRSEITKFVNDMPVNSGG